MSPRSKDPCVKFSCILEACTRKNNYNADLCKKELDNLLACCAQFGPKAAPCCEGFHELDEQFKILEERAKENSSNATK